MRRVNPALYEEVERGEARRREAQHGDEATPPSHSGTAPLHAHEVTADDAALIRMMAGARFKAGFTLELPSGKKVSGAEMRRWLNSHDRR